MANKQDVYNAFYSGFCTALMTSEVYRSISPTSLEVDTNELKEFIEENPHYSPIMEILE